MGQWPASIRYHSIDKSQGFVCHLPSHTFCETIIFAVVIVCETFSSKTRKVVTELRGPALGCMSAIFCYIL